MKEQHSAIDVEANDTPFPVADADDGRTHHSHGVDDSLLHRAVADAGRWAYGTVFVEMWVWNDDRTVLFRPEAGWWVDPIFHQQTHSAGSCIVASGGVSSCPICRLTDSSRDDLVQPAPLSAGVGLPGVLWSETGRGGGSWRRSWRGSHNSQSRRKRHRVQVEKAGTTPVVFPDTENANNNSETATKDSPVYSRYVAWRDIQAIVNDPDQPWNPRLQVLGTLGLGWVAAVDFDKLGHLGIVVYMARQGVDLQRLQSSSNEDYLLAAADLCSAAYALRSPRRQVVHERRHELHAVLRRVKNRILLLHRMGVTLEQLSQSSTAGGGAGGTATTDPATISASNGMDWSSTAMTRCSGKQHHVFKAITKRMASTWIKSRRGGNVQAPPTMGWQQSFLTFVGCLVTLSMLTRMNVTIAQNLGSDYVIPLPPFGALMTLLYGLSAAPASQPRNAIVGQFLSIAIAIGIGNISTLSTWLRQSIATSLAIAAMVKLGVTHPPAGAAAMLFATGTYGWGNLLYVLIGTTMAVLTATIINNVSDARHYPTYWGFDIAVPMFAAFHAIKVSTETS